MQSHLTHRLLRVSCIAVSAVVATPAATLRAQSATGTVTSASFSDPASQSAAVQQLTFEHRNAHIGDQVRQRLAVEMELKSTVRQARQIVSESHAEFKQQQERIVAALAVHDNMMSSARVRYVSSEKETTVGEQQTGAQPDPVVGKTYHCKRDGEKLVITDGAGQMPSFAEYEIVARSMEGLGRPNPLAAFLSGKTLAIGHQLSLPLELAEQLFGLGEAIDQIDKFELILDGTKTLGNTQCAVFHVLMEASQYDKGQMRLLLEGPMVVDPQTCRLVTAELKGPLGLAQSVGAAGTSYHTTGTGRLRVSIQSRYADAQ